jgi:hypothetical protein
VNSHDIDDNDSYDDDDDDDDDGDDEDNYNAATTPDRKLVHRQCPKCLSLHLKIICIPYCRIS